MPAKVRLATGKDFGRNPSPQPTWAEEIAKVKPTLTQEATRMSALVVEPEQPLPVATNWKLSIATTLTNPSGHDTLAQGDDIALGEVRPFNVTTVNAHTPFVGSSVKNPTGRNAFRVSWIIFHHVGDVR